jgi:hypothetical protein
VLLQDTASCQRPHSVPTKHNVQTKLLLLSLLQVLLLLLLLTVCSLLTEAYACHSPCMMSP